MVPSPISGQFKDGGRVQPTESSMDLKGLNEQALEAPLLEGEESEMS